MNNYEGIFPIALTTFNEQYEIDERSQLALINYLIDCGVHGLAIFGNASEGYALSESEKARLMPLIIKEVRKRVPVFVSTGHTGTHVAAKSSSHPPPLLQRLWKFVRRRAFRCVPSKQKLAHVCELP